MEERMSDNINKNQTEIIIEKKQANNERRLDQSAEKQIEDNKEIKLRAEINKIKTHKKSQ